ncbi:hypothetical protein QBC47DRAFT_409655 [Echria macrotheca]|uniref:C2H2-type domain-containing protein n=1 Tax=Echria macrotheca TaxID=438768 RepID=A0AAJ0BKJ4_9PEZI|nr:hypothetical protein QBC47DRAFT_409655 [Echria macrotheca]
MGSISALVSSCSRALNTLLDTLEFCIAHDDPSAEGISVSTVKEQQTRFRLWVGNVGADHSGTRYLAYRLRDASHLEGQTIRLLECLAELAEDATSILLGEITPWDKDDHDDDSDLAFSESADEYPLELDERTELAQTSLTITEMLDCLFRLSIPILNPSPHDRIITVPVVPTAISYDDHWFPAASSDQRERLRIAMTRRLQHLGRLRRTAPYRARSTEKTSENREDAPKDVVRDETAVFDEYSHSSEAGSETSIDSEVEDLWRSRPENSTLNPSTFKRPIECRLCGFLITAKTRKAWMKHVLADLRPYICLFPDCVTPLEDYATRRQWAQHILHNHWRFWTCPLGCVADLHSAEGSRDHIVSVHPGCDDVGTLVNASESPRPPHATPPCPLCGANMSSFKEYARHVGRHQMRFVLRAFLSHQHDEGRSSEVESELAIREEELLRMTPNLALGDPGTSGSHESKAPAGHDQAEQTTENIIWDTDDTAFEPTPRTWSFYLNQGRQDSRNMSYTMESSDEHIAGRPVLEQSMVAEPGPISRVDSLPPMQAFATGPEGPAISSTGSPDVIPMSIDPRPPAPQANKEIATPSENDRHLAYPQSSSNDAIDYSPAGTSTYGISIQSFGYARSAGLSEGPVPVSPEFSTSQQATPALSYGLTDSTPLSDLMTPSEQSQQSPRTQGKDYENYEYAGPRNFICEVCNRSFDQIHKLNHHRRYHERPHECPFAGCSMRFGTKTHLDRHLNDKHYKLRKYYCPVAGCAWSRRGNGSGEKPGAKWFPRKDNIRRHMANKHQIQQAPDDSFDVVEGDDDWMMAGL